MGRGKTVIDVRGLELGGSAVSQAFVSSLTDWTEHGWTVIGGDGEPKILQIYFLLQFIFVAQMSHFLRVIDQETSFENKSTK